MRFDACDDDTWCLMLVMRILYAWHMKWWCLMLDICDEDSIFVMILMLWWCYDDINDVMIILQIGPAQACGLICIGDVLVGVGGDRVKGMGFSNILGEGSTLYFFTLLGDTVIQRVDWIVNWLCWSLNVRLVDWFIEYFVDCLYFLAVLCCWCLKKADPWQKEIRLYVTVLLYALVRHG